MQSSLLATLPIGALLLAVLSACGGGGSGPVPSDAAQPAPDFRTLQTKRIRVGDQDFEVWVARLPEDQARGLRGATEEDLAPLQDGTPRGMLFPFTTDRIVTIEMDGVDVPLDLAFIDGQQVIFETHGLQPGDDPVQSGAVARWALEVRGGDFAQYGVGVDAELGPAGGN